MNLMDINERLQIINEMVGSEEKNRKQDSFKQFEVYQGRIHQYVYEAICKRFGKQNADTMPIISSINLEKRIVDQEAALYKKAPTRTFTDLNDNQLGCVNSIYHDMGINSKLLASNRYFRMQLQNLLMILPVDGKLICRILKNHNVTVIPNKQNPEIADAYIISSFDKGNNISSTPTSTSGYGDNAGINYNDGINQKIGDPNDYKGANARHLVWSKEFNFIMDGKGNILSEDVVNPIGILPFVEVSAQKDFEFWIRQGQSLADSTIDYNLTLSSVAQVVEMNGFAQAIAVGLDIGSECFTVGPNRVLKLEVGTNDRGDTIVPDFKYATPNADIQGSINFSEVILSNILTSRGLDPKIVNGKAEATRFSSGTERLLSMIESFNSASEDIAIYQKAESDIYKIIKEWLRVLNGTEALMSEYRCLIPDSSYVNIKYDEPTNIMSEQDKLDCITQKRDLDISSIIDDIQLYYGMDRDQAIEKFNQIKEDKKDYADQQIESNKDSSAGSEGFEA